MMKKWQMGAIAAALAAVAVGAVGVSLAGPSRQAGAPVVVAATVVVANPGWTPSGPVQPRPAVLPKAPALPPATGPVLFSSDFSSPDISAWHSPLLPSTDLAPRWLVQDGTFVQAGDSTGQDSADEAYAFTGQSTWSRLIFESSVLATSGADTGVVWNVQGDSFYRLQLLANLPNSAPKARLELVQHGRPTLLAATTPAAYPGYTPYVWQTVRVVSSGGRQQVWVNGTPLFDIQNAALSAGQVGLYAWADSATRFANVRVQSAP